MIETTVKFTYTNTITYNIFFMLKIPSSLSLLPVCLQIFIQLQFDSKFFSVSFLICEVFIELRMISIVLLHSYKESNKKTAFLMVEEFWIYFICTAKFLTSLDGGGILDLFYLYCKIWMSTKYYLLDSIHVPKILLSN